MHVVPTAACYSLFCCSFAVQLWLISGRRVARLSFMLTSLDVAYLGIIWQATGNLATPVTAASMHAAAELLLGEQQKQQQGQIVMMTNRQGVLTDYVI